MTIFLGRTSLLASALHTPQQKVKFCIIDVISFSFVFLCAESLTKQLYIVKM